MLLSCDYSQVELRLLAHVSQDPELLGAFHRDEDVHATTAAAILGVPLAEVTYEQRSLAKAINFGLMYGMGDYGLAAPHRPAPCPRRASSSTPTLAAFSQRQGLSGRDRCSAPTRLGYVETVLGRRRYFPELTSAQRQPHVHARRRARRGQHAHPGQRRRYHQAGHDHAAPPLAASEGLARRMVLQVHDELVLEVPEQELDAVRALVVETMQNAYHLSVPLQVDTAIGQNWMEMK